MDLKAHQLEAHPNGLSKDARRDARIVDLSSFDYRTPYQPQRQRRGAGRGRDPNADPLPASSAQPLRRDEVAYQRHMAIQSAQSVSTRSFGGQLSRNDTQPVRAPDRSANATPTQSPPVRNTPPVSGLESLNLGADSGPATPQEQARRLRHSSVIERASNLLRNDQAKLSEFRTKVSYYRSSRVSAIELIDSFFSLFDTSSSELGKLIKELAEIYEDESKKRSLLEAWSDWRAINEDYPALPGPSGILPGMSPSTVNGSGAGGKRVLRLKSSTAQSSRSAVGRSGAFPGSPSNPFPPLSSSTARSNSRNTTAWGTAPAPSPSVSSAGSRVPRTPSSRPTPSTSSGDAFPALPAAPKPNVLMAGLTRGTVRWGESHPAQNAWSSSAPESASTSANVTDSELGESTGTGGKKGKGKKGKQTLFHFG